MVFDNLIGIAMLETQLNQNFGRIKTKNNMPKTKEMKLALRKIGKP